MTDKRLADELLHRLRRSADAYVHRRSPLRLRKMRRDWRAACDVLESGLIGGMFAAIGHPLLWLDLLPSRGFYE
jgi:hypothetical protein